MKTLVFYNRGPLQEYLLDNVRHTLELHNGHVRIYLLTDNDIKIPGVETVNIRGYPSVNLINCDPNGSPFWVWTTLRFFDIAHFMKLNPTIDGVYHLENDTLLFTKLDNLVLYDKTKIHVPQDSEFRAIGCICWLPSYEAMVGFLTFVLRQQKVMPLNDMNYLGLYRDKCHFPIFPSGDGAGVFDAAHLGQSLFGTHGCPNVSFENETCVLKVKNHKIDFKNNCVYLDECKVNNIHIHSKDLRGALDKIKKLSLL
jgi:hypothetical protein